MKSLTNIKLLLLLLFCSFTFQSAQAQKNRLKKKDLLKVKSMMCGAFDSRAQAMQDSANYMEIHLHMVPIWKKRKDGFWLYVEQAVASAQDRPYRQRVYHVYLSGDTAIISEVYELNKPLRFAGAWKENDPLKNLNTDSLVSRNGCAIMLTKNTDGTFNGKTGEKTCPSNLRGAIYATSEVTLSPEQMVSWDRGFNAENKQVWGAEKGGYIFRKRSN
jgi:hypothetical protein